MAARMCAWCGKEYTAEKNKTLCCSRECGHKYAGFQKRGIPIVEYENKNCENCGKPLTRSQLKTKNKFCSQLCAAIKNGIAAKQDVVALQNRAEKFAFKFRELYGGQYEYVSGYAGNDALVVVRCLECGAEQEVSSQCVRRGRIAKCKSCFALATEKKATEQEALMAARRVAAKAEQDKRRAIKEEQRLAARSMQHTYVCVECGEGFASTRAGKKYCSKLCARRRGDHNKELKRRTRLIENGHIDWNVTLDRLIKRDKNVCHICGGKCNKKDKRTDENGTIICGNDYPSVDHLQAVANGGTHTWDNVKLSHRHCNTMKRDLDVYENQSGQMVLAI